MKRNQTHSLSPSSREVTRHLGALVRQARLARGWTLAELAERSRVSLATTKRIESGASSASLASWLALLERLGLLPKLLALEDPASEALLNQTRAQRARRKPAKQDLDF
jgi:transcriptional regulator with XRE-family HTH domain